MSELLNVLHTLVAEADAGRPSVFYVILEKRGAAPREPGAAMLVRTDGSAAGTIGGGAVEAAMQRRAPAFLREARPVLLEVSLDEDDDSDDASICGGHLTIGVVPIITAPDARPFRNALRAASRGETAQIPIVLERDGGLVEYRLNVEVPPTLLIAGAGHVGRAVARFAAELDFRVVVIDDRADLLTAERFGPRAELRAGDIAGILRDYPLAASCYVVIMTRGHRHDRAALEAVIDRPTAYVGMIASHRKAAVIRDALRSTGFPQDRIDRVHTPIGLPIGAETVNEIAISVVAELIQTRRRLTPQLVSIGPRQSAAQR